MADELQARLEAAGQGHLSPFVDALRHQIEGYSAADWQQWRAALAVPDAATAQFEPIAAVPAVPPDIEVHQARGEALLRAGKVAAFVVAGGQGTRLGYDGPKGEVPATPITRTSLFGVFAGQIKAARDRYGVAIPWYVMGSPHNLARTQAFFAEHGFFGLDPADVMFFAQGVLPSFDKDGRALLAAPDQLLCNPDGHGGSLTALARSGALADMHRRGITQIAYFQVDNPLTRVIDPVFLGLHMAPEMSSGEFSSKMVAKAQPDERVGVFGRIDGGYGVIEYSDLPATLATQRRADGSLLFNAGNVAVHLMSRAFVARLAEGELPLHAAHKICPSWDPATQTQRSVNGIKLERFVFDALAYATQPLVWTVERAEAFAPIKNRDGTDSPATSEALQIARAARWLAANGVQIPRRADGTPDCVLEIRPETAACAADLADVDVPARIEPGARLVF